MVVKVLLLLLFMMGSQIQAETPQYECSINILYPSICYLVELNRSSTDIQVKSYLPSTDVGFVNSTVEILTRHVCKALPSIENFHADELGLSVIEKDAFNACASLKFVNLSSNSLQNLPVGLFDENEQLKEVDLSSNQLTTLDFNVFRYNQNLEAVILDHNQVKELLLPPELPKIGRLKYLDLRYNNLSDINVELLLSKCPNMSVIFLAGNQFQCDRQSKLISFLDDKDVYMDSLTECMNGPTKTQSSVLNSSSTLISYSPNDKDMNDLLFGSSSGRKCSKSQAPMESWCFFVNMDIVTTKNNFRVRRDRNFEDIDGVIFLDTKISVLTGDVCEELPYVQSFYGTNLGMTTITQDTFERCGNLIRVSLAGNSLKQLPSGLFDSNKKLREVEVQCNRLTVLDWNLFRNNPNLRLLNISDNQIVSFQYTTSRLDRLLLVSLMNNRFPNANETSLELIRAFPSILGTETNITSIYGTCSRLDVVIVRFKGRTYAIREATKTKTIFSTGYDPGYAYTETSSTSKRFVVIPVGLILGCIAYCCRCCNKTSERDQPRVLETPGRKQYVVLRKKPNDAIPVGV